MGNGMERIWNFFENMNEYVYVADADTHELVYMNKKMRDTYGIHSKEELAGKKCYELLQNSSLPCTICNNDELQEGQFKEWRYFNPLLNKYFKIKDTVVEDNGRRYRIEIALNISSQEHQKNVVRRYEKLEKIVNEGLRLALGTSSADKSLDIILEYIGKALDGERTYIFEHNENGYDDNTYEWVANGIKPEKDNLQNLPPELCANWYRNFQEDKNIVKKLINAKIYAKGRALPQLRYRRDLETRILFGDIVLDQAKADSLNNALDLSAVSIGGIYTIGHKNGGLPKDSTELVNRIANTPGQNLQDTLRQAFTPNVPKVIIRKKASRTGR